MLILDQTYQWTGFGDGQGLWTSQCRLRIYRTQPSETIVIVSDMGSESGTSITNCAAQLASKAVQEFQLDPATLLWIEQYPDSLVEYSVVQFSWLRQTASGPSWQFIPAEKVESLLHGTASNSHH